MIRLFKRLSLLERLAFAFSILYGIGVLLLLQHSALYIGFERIDFLRLKPILVGLQFVIYLCVPFVVFVLPVILACNIKLSSWTKVLVVFICILFLMIAVATMFHYFIPYTYMKDATSDSWSYLSMVWNFWQMYFYWDAHIVAHVLFSVAILILARPVQMHLQKYRLVAQTPKGIHISALILLLVAACMAMFVFNRDIYMNISQSVGGGAPKAGIITITNPGQFLKSSNVHYAEVDNELSKPCFIVEEDSDFVYIAEMFEFTDNIAYLRMSSVPMSICRIPKQNVIQFAPISYYQRWHKYLAEKVASKLEYDVIQHIKLMVGIQVKMQVHDSLIVQSEALQMMTNAPVLTMWIDNDGVDVVPAHSYCVVPEGETNMLVKISFGPLHCQKGQQVVQYHYLLTNDIHRVGFKIDNLPALPHGCEWGTGFAMGVACNYLCNFDIMPNYQPVFLNIDDKESLIMRKKAFCRNCNLDAEQKGD